MGSGLDRDVPLPHQESGMWPIPKRRLCLGVACILLLFVSIAWAAEVSLKALISNPAQFDGRAVTLRGTAAWVKETVSRRGSTYTTFQVRDPSGAGVKVFTWGHPGIKDGDPLEVAGVFQRVKRVGQYTFYNEVEAQDVRLLRR